MKNMTALADSTDREAWLKARKHIENGVPLITASQVSSIVGTNPYTKLIDVWNEKHDPDWTEERNWRLDERAAYGNAQEASLVEFASQELGIKVTANTILYTSERTPGDACTPDAYGYRPRKKRPVIVDAKTTETDWRTKGVAPHVLDQMLWTWHVTDAEEIWLAVEHVKWTKGTPTVLERYMIEVPLDEWAHNRLAFLKEQVAEFRRMVAEDIAPESDIDIRDIGFDTDPEDAALFAKAEAALVEIAEIDERTAEDIKRRAVLVDQVKAAVKEYGGRRVHLIGTRKIAKLVRFWSAKPHPEKLDARALAATITWEPSERVVIEDNPEWQPADG